MYVEDYAAITQDTLKQVKAAQAHLLTRAPNQLKIVKEALQLAEQPETNWSERFQSNEANEPGHFSTVSIRASGCI